MRPDRATLCGKQETDMGAQKHLMMRRQDLVAEAIPIAIEAGALKACWLHGDDMVMRAGTSEGERRAYAMGTNAWKAGDVSGERDEFMSAIKEASEFAPDVCWRCEKLKDE
jgi:hypothetical protein